MHSSSPKSRGPARLLRRGVLLAALGLAAAPVAALAGTASVSGTTLSYVAAAGENNNAVITFNAVTNEYTIDELDLVPVTPVAPQCVASGPTAAICTLVGATAVTVDLGDLYDLARMLREQGMA